MTLHRAPDQLPKFVVECAAAPLTSSEAHRAYRGWMRSDGSPSWPIALGIGFAVVLSFMVIVAHGVPS